MNFTDYLVNDANLPYEGRDTVSAVGEEVKRGDLIIPPDAITDTRSWIKEEANSRCKAQREERRKRAHEALEDFKNDLEVELDAKSFSAAGVGAIHTIVRERLDASNNWFSQTLGWYDAYYEDFESLINLAKLLRGIRKPH